MNNPKISIIVAVGENNVIGSTKTNDLLWRIPEDLKHFKELTTGHAIIMGRKTHESIGKPLPNRLNIVITHSIDISSDQENLMFVNSLENALTKAQEFENGRKDEVSPEIFIIGGGQIYQQALPLVDKLYLTKVNASFTGDIYFPDYSQFKNVVSKQHFNSDKYSFDFFELEK